MTTMAITVRHPSLQEGVAAAAGVAERKDVITEPVIGAMTAVTGVPTTSPSYWDYLPVLPWALTGSIILQTSRLVIAELCSSN